MSIFFLTPLLMIILITVSSFASEEEDALLGLKSGIVDRSNSLRDWTKVNQTDNGSSSICIWSGITCLTDTHNNSVVIGLDLSQRNLSGSISGKYINILSNLVLLNLSHNSFTGELPAEIFTTLANLTVLDISRNSFDGHFPTVPSNAQKKNQLSILDAFSNSFSGPLPDQQLSKLEFLKVLNLAGSYFEGPIPASYGSFKNLEFLHLAGNLLDGEIPPELGSLKTLTHIEIGYNSYMQGSIPPEFGSMTQLQYLDIAGANISGSIPSTFCNLRHLESLFLFRNHLTGSIPSCFGNISSLKNLDLSDNSITGPIPDTFAKLINLRLLSLMYNQMNSSIPRGIENLPNLEALLIWNNLFTGSLPLNLGMNSKLKWVDVSNNNLHGNIPAGICYNRALSRLILFSNSFTGELSTLTNCSSLVRLRIENNSFSGDIFALKLSLRYGATYVDLSQNNFTGGIPENLMAEAPKIEYFNVSYNPGLGGIIPSHIWSLPSLANFSASFCNISGDLPQPTPNFQCSSSISTVELSGNKLSGDLPESIASCEALNILDLSHNKLSGSIPDQFGSSSSLALLNISFNQLSGSVPRSNNFIFTDASAFIGNPDLCGAPLKPCNGALAALSLSARRKSVKRRISLICFGVVLLVAASICLLLYLVWHQKVLWKMISFTGLPEFTAKDILRSINSTYVNVNDFSTATVEPPLLSSSSLNICKVVLPTGITVSVKKIGWESRRRRVISEFINLLGNVRHKNLVRLLGFCSNKSCGYLLFDYYLPSENLSANIVRLSKARDTATTTSTTNSRWAVKYKIIMGIARGLCYLHNDCHPPIPHGDLKATNILFDEGNMEEPHLADFGVKAILRMLNNGTTNSVSSTVDDLIESASIKEEMYRDICSFGEIILEILRNGKPINAGGSITPSNPTAGESFLREVLDENDEVKVGTSEESEIKLVLEVALLCTSSKPSNRPTMDEALKLLLSGV
ncbi:leucine-rich repeat receptor-like protein kinase TDR [Papaver somniferum]|nr:leucine-rich repeat receptor-like protein kinase TDR [Papaver somniferum]